MDKITQKFKSLQSLVLLYISVFLLAFHYYLFYFINSSFLGQFWNNTEIGILYGIAAVLNILAFSFNYRSIIKIGNFKVTISLILIEAASLLGLSFFKIPLIIAILFVTSFTINSILVFNLDIFLESFSVDEKTGGIRGLFLTAGNLPPVIAPLIVGVILSAEAYSKIYLTAAILLIPLLYLIYINFKDWKDPVYQEHEIIDTLKQVRGNKDLKDIFIDYFLLNFFYGWMVIYMPIYLHENIGFSWSQIGIIFSIMLLPFLLFQLPLGELADKKYGEKEFLVFGFFVAGISTMIISHIHQADIVLWSAILFITRIGASFIELAVETYFFKKISPKDTNVVSLFRTNRALPYLVVPPIAMLSISLFGLGNSFMVLGIIMFIGLRYAFLITDTK
ncbi:MAG: MFS transporter [bacterium]